MACPPAASAQAAQGRMRITMAFAVPTGERLEKTYEWRQGSLKHVGRLDSCKQPVTSSRGYLSDGVGTGT